METNKVLEKAANKLNELSKLVGEHIGEDVRLSGEVIEIRGQQYIRVISDNMLEHFGSLGKFMFSDIRLKAYVNEPVKEDLDHLWTRFDFDYIHPDGGKNGIELTGVYYEYDIQKDKWIEHIR